MSKVHEIESINIPVAANASTWICYSRQLEIEIYMCIGICQTQVICSIHLDLRSL